MKNDEKELKIDYQDQAPSLVFQKLEPRLNNQFRRSWE